MFLSVLSPASHAGRNTRRTFAAAFALALACAFAPAHAQDPKTCTMVFVHGQGASAQQLAALSRKLQGMCAARLVEMPWSARHADAARDGLQDIAALVKNLRREGTKRLILVGHGLGANAAFVYAAGRGDTDGIVAIGGDTAPNARGWGDLATLPPKVPQGIPLLWIVGSNDPLRERGEAYAFAKAPPHPANRWYAAKSDANATPEAVWPPIAEWIKSLD